MSEKMRFEGLNCWKSARVLTMMIYKLTSNSKFQYDYDLIRQLRRASTSVMSNIAEGHSRSSDKDKKRFMELSLGSCLEIKSQLYIASDLKYIDQQERQRLFNQIEKVKALILGFIKYLNNKNSRQ